MSGSSGNGVEQTVTVGKQVSQEDLLAWIRANRSEADVSHNNQGITVSYDSTVTHYRTGRNNHCFKALLDIADGNISVGGTASAVDSVLGTLGKGLKVFESVSQALEWFEKGDIRSITKGTKQGTGAARKGAEVAGDAAACAAGTVIPNAPYLKGTPPPGRR